MGANAGPDIVSDGLVLALDAADNNSFRGEPASNLATSLGSWSVFRSSITQTSDVDPPVLGAPVYILERTSTSAGVLVRDANSGFGYTNNSNFANVGDGTWRYSIYVKGHPDTESNTSFQIDIGDRNSQSTSVSSTTGWTKLETTDAGGLANASYKFFDFSINGGVGNKIYVSAVFIDTGIPSGVRWLPEGTTRGTTVATGGGWADISGNSNHGEILNGTSTSNDNTVLGALDFDGTNDYIRINHSGELNFNSSDFTATNWCRVDGSSGAYRALWQSSVGVSTTRQFGIVASTNNKWGIWMTINDVFANRLFSDTSVVIGEWIMVTMVYRNNESLKLYLNGVEDKSVSISGNLTYTPTVMNLGARFNTAEHFNGPIATGHIYNKALTAQEVLQNYNATKTRFGL